MSAHDYEELGLVAGLEIHQQLDTAEKLFCACPPSLRDPDDAITTITRFLHPTRSELGEIDEAALEESRVEREFEYLAYDTTCLVEQDDEPPHRIDTEALTITLQIAQLLDMDVTDQIHVMRKIVIDGSNTSGFQRTALVARNGEIETDAGRVSIHDLLLEEESAQRVIETETGVQFSLDRLGIPLVEIGTGPDITSPQQARAAAEHIGMLLRSTGAVKRGIGSIRQDVNISIEDGARVELKGVQQLEQIEEIVRLEVDRQVSLLSIMEGLIERDATVGEPEDVTEVLADTESGVVQNTLRDDGIVTALPLYGFDSLLGRELQPDRRFGTELADHARRSGAGGLFHSDELPAYGISDDEVVAIRRAIGLGDDDAFCFVAASEPVAVQAIDAVADRARTAIERVPEETRDANEDGTSRYLRPLPGAARMYPETDVPPVEPDLTDIELPELLTEKVERYTAEYALDPGLAEQVAYGPSMPVFETAVDRGVDPTLAANTLASTLTQLRRDDVPVESLTDEQLLDVLETVTAGDIAREGVPELLGLLAERPTRTVAEGIEALGLGSAETDEIRAVVGDVVDEHADQVTAEGMGAFSALMGECMRELRGKADGETVSAVLREEIQARAG